MDYKYKTSFSSEIIGIGGDISKASAVFPDLSKLVPLFPREFNIKDNPDVFPHVIPIGMANRFNKNGEGVDFEGAKQIKDKLSYKYIDYQHDSSYIIGSILNVGFSSIDTDEIFDGDEDNEFFINCAGILYKEANRDLIKKIADSADPFSNSFGTYSASWEIGFSDYDIALGSSHISKCEIISDENKKSEFKKYLKVKGGTGFTSDGVQVSRILKGVLYPLGFGIVHKPAAYVKGLYGINEDNKPSLSSENAKKIFTGLSTVSQLKNNDVNFLRTTMDKELLDAINGLKTTIESAKDGKSVAATAHETFEQMKDLIVRKSDEWAKEKADLSKKEEEASKAKEQAEKELTKLKEDLSTVNSELDSLKSKVSAAEAKSIFDARMTKLTETYAVDEELQKIFASDLKDMDSSEDTFNAYLTKASVMLKGREKSEAETKNIALANEIVTKAKDKKVSFEDLKVALASAEIEISDIPNSNHSNNNSLKDKFFSAFGKDGLIISK